MRNAIKAIITNKVIADRLLEFINDPGCTIDIEKASGRSPTYIFLKKDISVSEETIVEYYHVSIEFMSTIPNRIHIAIQKNNTNYIIIRKYYYDNTIYKVTSMIYDLVIEYFKSEHNKLNASERLFAEDYPFEVEK